jgi:hypothetical protein
VATTIPIAHWYVPRASIDVVPARGSVLAARAFSRIREFTRAQIAAVGLDQRFGLLTGVEQTVFRRLAVFAAGFDYPAARRCPGSSDPIPPPGPGGRTKVRSAVRRVYP